MTPELLLILAASLIAVTLWSAWLKRAYREELPYLLLLAGDLVLLAALYKQGRSASLAAWAAEAVAVVLTLGPLFLDRLERRALERERMRTALAVAWLRRLIMPGQVARRRHRELEQLAQARSGRVGEVLARLEAELVVASTPARRAELHREIATALLIARRFTEGAAYVEEHLPLAEAVKSPLLAAYLVRAYGELGELARAAMVLQALESGPARRDPEALAVLYQARLSFLAFAGRPESLEVALQGRGPLPKAARAFLLELARRRAREPVAQPPEVAAFAGAVAARVALKSVERAPLARAAPVTLVLLIANVLTFVFVAFFLDSEVGLIRAGALFRPAVENGEWWRAVGAMFLHAGLIHLLSNMYGLYLLGRFAEEICGSARFFIIYVVGGLAGAAASTWVGRGAISVGASGAIMGLLGALIVVLVLRRSAGAEAWRRELIWKLVFLGALQVYIGFAVPMIDNAAHVGGMAGGAAAALWVAPRGLLGGGRLGSHAVVVVAAALALFIVMGALEIVRTPLERSLERLPERSVKVSRVELTVPSYWRVDPAGGYVEDPYVELRLEPRIEGGRVRLEPKQPVPRAYRPLILRIERSAHVVL